MSDFYQSAHSAGQPRVPNIAFFRVRSAFWCLDRDEWARDAAVTCISSCPSRGPRTDLSLPGFYFSEGLPQWTFLKVSSCTEILAKRHLIARLPTLSKIFQQALMQLRSWKKFDRWRPPGPARSAHWLCSWRSSSAHGPSPQTRTHLAYSQSAGFERSDYSAQKRSQHHQKSKISASLGAKKGARGSGPQAKGHWTSSSWVTWQFDL